MPRRARLVVPHHPHHVTQRGNRRQPTFFSPDDYAFYLTLLRRWAAKADTAIWAWCLMPNHVHLILVPSHADGLRATLGETHRRYTRAINLREGQFPRGPIFARAGAGIFGKAALPRS